MTKIASISLDIRKNNTVDNEPIILRQGDNDVIIEASISNNGYPNIEIDFATFVAKKSDGTIISNDPTNVNGNVISYPISKHLTESVGKIQDAYFMINNQITTCGFDISIIPSAQLDDTSVNYIPGIESINKFLESAEADWLGRIQQMKSQIDGLDIPQEFKLLMDKALSDAKAQYQPTIDSAEANVENIVADLAAKKLDLTNNSDELNKTIATIKAQVASVTSFLDGIQKQIIAANASFTTGQQAKISQSIADGQKKLADSIASMQSKFETDSNNLKSQVAQVITDLKNSSSSAITDMQNNQSTAMAKVNQDITDTNASIQRIQQSAKNINDSIQNIAVGDNLLLKTDKPFSMTGNGASNKAQQMYALSRRLEAGDTVTLSFDAVSTAPAEFTIQNNGAHGGTWMNYITSTVDTTKKHYVATITLDGFSDRGINMLFYNEPSTTTATISNIKLQLGLNDVVSSLSQTVDSMKLDLSKKIEQKDLNGYATQAWTQDQIKSISDSIASLETKIDKLSQGKQ
ncbi:MAG TPA: hypothetical protein H9820_05270 [Candidatus Companilactobacillus pullicola]|uniref:DUF2479 domain-containing protein n=1 Tax=Candidatus Companilactobacillus pullicola TaxID=2838523 RepID=A0A9D2CLX4_9LACO|nr:hypothetical protein [Candidatus Companilactobacillus pullicola]